jgi:hypothetical protein
MLVFRNMQGILGRPHKIYFAIAQTSSPTDFLLLISYLGKVNLQSSSEIRFSSEVSVLNS